MILSTGWNANKGFPSVQEKEMRSSRLMSRNDTGLLVIDLQTKLLDKIPHKSNIIAKTLQLVEGAKILEIPVFSTEQYPKGLGPTVPELAGQLTNQLEKVSFSCGVLPEVIEFFKSKSVQKILLAGIETHVCVLQTALDLMAQGFLVYLAVDAAGSRHEQDREWALRRLETAGVVLTTAETALFEWAEKAGTPEFKEISRLVMETDEKLK
jgi:nicotinamidase-related amidase